MAKTKISEWSTTPSSNTDIDGINIAEGCAPSGINDAIRDMMAQIRSWQSGASADPFNGPMNGTIGATTAYSGAFTTLSASSTVTFSGGTANGVAYLNGSKVVTSGSALTFDGTDTFTVGATNTGILNLGLSAAYRGKASYDASGNTLFTFENTYANASAGIAWKTNGSEQMRLNSTGLGIGTSSPSYKLQLNSGSAVDIETGVSNSAGLSRFGTRGSGNSFVGAFTAGKSLEFWSAGSLNVTLDAAGNLGLGVTPSAWTSGRPTLEFGGSVQSTIAFNGNTTNGGAIWTNSYFDGAPRYKANGPATIFATMNGVSGAGFQWLTAPSGTAGNAISFTQAMTLDASGNLLVGTTTAASGASIGLSVVKGGGIQFGGATGGGGALVGNSGGGILFFGYAGNQGSEGYAERARIDSSGNLLVGTTSGYGGPGRINVGFNQSTNFGITLRNTSASATGVFVSFENSGGGGNGSISQTNSTTVAYNTSSDRRLKKDIVPAPDAGGDIDAIEIVTHGWISNEDTVKYGVIAQDLVAVVPNAVRKGDDGEEVLETWGVDYSKLVPMLVKEIQSLRKRLADAGL